MTSPTEERELGTVLIVPKEHTVWVTANMSAPPADGKVYEGWFVDDGGSGYKLSLGEFSKNGTLNIQRTDGQSLHLHPIHSNRRAI